MGFGQNENGQLGIGNNENKMKLILIMKEKIKKIECGEYHNLILKKMVI